jgi:hypothetical protein
MKYDVFISYRREGGYETAKHLNDLLVRDGYKVSFDIDTLRSGDFDTQLLTRIEQCKDFILIVDEHAFDRTIDPETNPNEDWLRCELAHALKHNKNIIPVFLSGVAGFPDGLPDDVVGVKTKQSPKYDMFYFDQFYKLLKEYMVSKPQKLTSILLISFVLLIAASLYLVLESGNKIEHSFYQQYVIIDSTNKELVFDINGVVFKMIKVDGGTFHMGAQSEFPNSINYDVEAYPSEGPVHYVTLSDYYIGETEVTIELWETVMGGGDISNDKDSLKPIGAVSYNDCIDFLIQLNKYTGKDFRLPTEAEFEYASRGGKKMYPTKFSGANNMIMLHGVMIRYHMK